MKMTESSFFFCIKALVYNKNHIRGHVWPLPKLEMSHLFSEKRDCSLSINPHGDPVVSSEVITAPKTVSVLSNISKKKQNSLREFGGEQQPVGFSEDSRASSCIWLEALRSGNELMSYSCCSNTSVTWERRWESGRACSHCCQDTAWPRVRSWLTPDDNLVFDSGGGINDNIKKNIKRFGKTRLVRKKL